MVTDYDWYQYKLQTHTRTHSTFPMMLFYIQLNWLSKQRVLRGDKEHTQKMGDNNRGAKGKEKKE